MVKLKLVRSEKINLKRKHDYLLIIGDGRSLIEDLRTPFSVEHDVMSIGRSVGYYNGQIKHWVNVDGPGSKWWAEHLPQKNNGKFPVRHTLGECDGYDCIWDDGLPDDSRWNGSSSLFATYIGLTLGYKSILLAGCPLDKEGHWYFAQEYKGPLWREEDYQAWREFAKLPEAKRVKSLSGWTKEILNVS